MKNLFINLSLNAVVSQRKLQLNHIYFYPFHYVCYKIFTQYAHQCEISEIKKKSSAMEEHDGSLHLKNFHSISYTYIKAALTSRGSL